MVEVKSVVNNRCWSKSEGFLHGSDSEESACNAGDPGLIPGLGRSPGWGYGNPLQYSCLENPHGQRSLVGYSPWGSQKVQHDGVTKHSTVVRYLPRTQRKRKLPVFFGLNHKCKLG